MTIARAIIDPETLPVMGRRWDLTTLGLLAALFVFMPAAFGAVEAWSELIVVVGGAILALVLALRTAIDRDFRPAGSWTYLPLALFLALVVGQLVPLTSGALAWVAPHTLATKTDLLGPPPPAATTISFYPRATVEYLRLVAVGAIVFVTVASVFRRPRQIKELLLVIFAIGCAQAALAIAQIATGAQLIYWTFPSMSGRVTSGSFVNYSNFCQFMNLSLAAGVALLLMQLYELRRHEIHGSFRRGVWANVHWEKHGWIVCGIMLAAVSVFTSMSRNGVLSLVVASAVIGFALYGRGTLSWRGWLLGLIPMGVLFVLLFFGFDMVYERLATLRDASGLEGRWQMTLAALRAWSEFPLWGTGLGTHEYVFPMFDESLTPTIAAQADNDYAQLLEETGLVGAILVAIFIASIATLTVRLMLRGRTPAAAAAFGLALGLLAVAIHSASDFGQRLPANFVLSATFCGLVVSVARIEARDRLVRRGLAQPPAVGRPLVRRTLAVVSLCAIVFVSGWALRACYAAYLAERWWAAALTMDTYIQKLQREAGDQDYVDLLAAAENAVRTDPANVVYAYGLNAYRWQALSRQVDPQSGKVLLHPDALPYVAQIADELDAVRRMCPTYGPPYALEGQLRLFVLGEKRGAELVRTGLRLAPYDAASCYVAGELAARERNLDEAERLFARAIALAPGYYRDVVRLCLGDLDQPELARRLADDDYRRLHELSSAAGGNAKYAPLAADVEAQAVESLRRHAASGDAQPYELATLAAIDQKQGELTSAINLYRQALRLDYNQVDWRLNLAQALAADGQFDDAMHEARICLRLRPEHPTAKKLLEQWTTRRESK